MTNTAPPPWLLRTLIVPLCCSIRRLQIDNPKPVPLDLVVKNPCGDDSVYLRAAKLLDVKDRAVVADWYTGNITFRISNKKYFDKRLA